MKVSKITVILILLLSSLAAPLHASSQALQELPESFTHEGALLKKVGQQSYRAMWVVQLFEAALYADSPTEHSPIPGDFPFALTLRYHRSFTAEQLIQSGARILSEQHPPELQQRFAQSVQHINRYYRDVDEGDAYTLAYVPDHGTTLMLNGKALVTLPGEDFAHYYFSIWLGDHPQTRKLRDALHP